MGRQDIEAGSAYVRLYMQQTEFDRGLRTLRRNLTKIGQDFTYVGGILSAAGMGIVGAVATAAKSFSSFGDTINDMSARTGIAAETLSELKYAAEQAGASLDTVETGIRKMQQVIGSAAGGESAAVETLENLGLAVESLAGMSPEEQFTAIAARVAAIEDPTLRAAAAIQVFGRSGTELLPMITSDLAGMREEARKLGLVMSSDTASAAAVLDDALNQMKLAGEAAWNKIGEAAAPILTDLVKRITDIAVQAGQWIDANKEVVVTVMETGAAVGAVGAALVAFGQAAGGLAAVVGTIASANPVVLALAATAGAASVAFALWGDEIKAALAPAFAELSKVAKGELLPAMVDLSASFRSLLTDARPVLDNVFGQTAISAVKNMAFEMKVLAAAAKLAADGWERIRNVKFRGPGTPLEDIYTGEEPASTTPASSIIPRLGVRPKGSTTVPSTTGGQAAPAADGTETEDVAKQNERMLEEISRERIKRIADETDRSIAEINRRYDAEIDKARELGADLALVEQARREAVETVQVDAQWQRQEELERSAETKADANQRLADDTKRLEIEQSTTDEKERQRRLLEFERGIALRDAQASGAAGADVSNINAYYDARLAGIRDAVRQQADGGPIGTFSTAAAAAMTGRFGGTEQQQMVRGIEKLVNGNADVLAALARIAGFSQEQIDTFRRLFTFA